MNINHINITPETATIGCLILGSLIILYGALLLFGINLKSRWDRFVCICLAAIFTVPMYGILKAFITQNFS